MNNMFDDDEDGKSGGNTLFGNNGSNVVSSGVDGDARSGLFDDDDDDDIDVFAKADQIVLEKQNKSKVSNINGGGKTTSATSLFDEVDEESGGGLFD